MSAARSAHSRQQTGGSRFLYDSFEAAQVRIDAQELVAEARREALEYRLARIESALERVEKRLWLAVYGLAASVLLHGGLALMQSIP